MSPTTTRRPRLDRASLRHRLAPLQARLAAVVVAVLAVGLFVTGATAWAVLSRSLVAEVDTQLEKVAEPLAQVASRNLLGGLPVSRTETESLPSDYFVLFMSADASVTRQWSSTASGEPRSAPALRALSLAQVLDLRGEQFSVSAIDGAARWRVLALPLASGTGSVAVALPLDTLDAASAQLRRVLLLVGALVTVAGGTLGAVAVRRSLRPLRQIEHTAAGIATGQLASRVPVTDAHTEVGHLATSLNAMLDRLELAFAAREASEERMRRFVSDASHELRTPLATVRGYAELYRMGAVTSPEELDSTMRRVEESATRMGLLVEDLLALARLDEPESTPVREPVDMVALARDAVQDLLALDPSREVSLVGFDDAPPAEALVGGDPVRLRQVVTNLVGNVASHTPRGTACEIAVGYGVVAGAEGGRAGEGTVGQTAVGQTAVGQTALGEAAVGQAAVVLEVRDRGPGLAPEHVDRIFERFYRADASRARGEGGGAGLGLAIVASIVAAHGGHVEAGSREGGGAVFRVVLPPLPAQTEPIEPIEPTEPTEP